MSPSTDPLIKENTAPKIAIREGTTPESTPPKSAIGHEPEIAIRQPLRTSSVTTEPQLPNWHSHNAPPKLNEQRQRRRKRLRRTARRPSILGRFRNLLVQIWPRLPFLQQPSCPALPGAEDGSWEPDDQNARIFPHRPKKRKGRPEGTKGAGSRSL